MGGGIAQVVAASGRRVSLYDAAPGAVERGRETMRKSLAKLAEKGGADPDEVLARVESVEDLLDPDQHARRRHRPARPRDRHALLQPGAGAEARRGRAGPRDLRRDGGG